MKQFLEYFNPENIKSYDGFVKALTEGILFGALPKIFAAISLGIFIYLVSRRRTNLGTAILFYALAFALTYLTQFFRFLM